MATEVTKAEARGSGWLWFGVLGGPAAWSLQTLIGSELDEIACSPGATTPDVVEPVVLAVSAACFLITILAGVMSWRCERRVSGRDDTNGRRASWMARAGILTSAFFVIAIFQGFLPSLFLSACQVGA